MITHPVAAYRDRVPNQPKTPKHGVRTPTVRWDAFGAAATKQGSDRTKILNQFMAWYAREAGAELPERPTVTEDPEK